MATYGDSYSRWIAWLKVVLPLAALAILSTLFLLSDRKRGEEALPYSQVELDRIVREQRVRNPNYSGVTADGAAITLAAGSATPDTGSTGRVDATGIIGAVEMPEGGRIDLSAADGTVDTTDRIVLMQGGVALRSSTGWRVDSDAMTANLDETRVVSPDAVTARGPAGRLQAGAMDVTLVEGRYLLRFTGGVNLIYAPPERGGDEQ